MNTTHWICYFLLGAVWLAGCGTDPAPETSTTQILFGPSASNMPFPNSAWLDPEVGTLKLPTEGASPAYSSLIDNYLNTLPAFPPDTGIMFRINAPRNSLDLESIPIASHVVDVTYPGQAELITNVVWTIEEDLDGSTRVVGSNSLGWELGHSYALVVTAGPRTLTGDPIEASPLFVQIRDGQTEELKIEPVLLEQLIASTGPVVQQLETGTIPGLTTQREDILILSIFDIQNGPVLRYDPIGGNGPFPDDQWMGQPPSDPQAATTAQQQLDAFVRANTGFSVTSRIFVPIAGLAEPSQEPEIELWDLGQAVPADSNAPIVVSHSQELRDQGLAITPLTANQTLMPNHRYLCVVRRPTDNTAVLYHPPLHFALLRASGELIFNGQSTVPFLTGAQAAALQTARDAFNLEESPVNDDTLLAWSWTTLSQVEALYQPQKEIIPVPNDRESISPGAFGAPPGLPEQSHQMVQGLLDGIVNAGGFPPNTILQIPMSGALDISSIHIVEEAHNPMNVAQGHILLMDITDIESPTDLMLLNDRPPLANFTIDSDSSGRLTLTPTNGGWPTTRRILAILLKTLPTVGSGPLQSTPDFFLSALEHPLVDPDSGESLVFLLSDAEANTLEMRRLENNFYSSLLSVATNGILDIEDVALFWTFQTIEPPMDELDELYIQMLLDSVDTSLKGGAFKNIQIHPPSSELDGYDLSGIGHVMLDGRYESRAMIRADQIIFGDDGNVLSFPEFEYLEDGTPSWSPDDVPFVVALPQGMPPQEGWPILIYQHDLGMNAMSLFEFAHRYTEQKIAVVAMDAYLHGARTPESKQDGDLYFDGTILALRDHLRQSTLDLMAFARFVRNGLAPLVKTYLYQQGTLHVGYKGLNITKVYFHGHGLGGLFGIPFLGLDSLVSRCALSMVGAPLIQLMLESEDPRIHSLVAGFSDFNLDIPEHDLSPIYDLLQWGIFSAEPIQYAPLVLDIMNTAPNNRRLFVQIAGADTTVSYDSSMSLWTRLHSGSAPERSSLKVYPDTCHQFLTEGCSGVSGITDPDSVPLAQQEALQDLLNFYQAGQFP